MLIIFRFRTVGHNNNQNYGRRFALLSDINRPNMKNHLIEKIIGRLIDNKIVIVKREIQ